MMLDENTVISSTSDDEASLRVLFVVAFGCLVVAVGTTVLPLLLLDVPFDLTVFVLAIVGVGVGVVSLGFLACVAMDGEEVEVVILDASLLTPLTADDSTD